MVDFSTLPLPAALLLFVFAAVAIGVAGTRLTRLADRLADITGLGEAIFGAVLLGASTSLPGIVTSVTAAVQGHAELAFSNAVGGIAAQTVFLAIADMFYRRANLEHAAASVANMMQASLLIILLMLAVMLMSGPEATLWRVHPGSVLLVLVYVFGLRVISRARGLSTWEAARTPETVPDRPREMAPGGRAGLLKLWIAFLGFAAVVGVMGWLVARTGLVISARTGMSETVVGGLFTAVVTSLPELVTSVAAVRQGALTLAVGNIIGGNSFDVLFLAFADIAYRPGSLYHAVSDRQVFIIALAATLSSILLLGLLRREKRGIANIGFESFLVLVLYLASMGFLLAGG